MRSSLRTTAIVLLLAPLSALPQAANAHGDGPMCFGKAATIVASSHKTIVVEGTDGPDVIVGYRRTTVYALGGDDLICGAAVVSGGDGDDKISYSGKYGPDEVDGDVHTAMGSAVGGDGDDRIIVRGSGIVFIEGNEGNDYIASDKGIQLIEGGPGADIIKAGLSNDSVWGNEGPDRLYGGFGPDDLEGGSGNDLLFGGPTWGDQLYGNGGRDVGYGGPASRRSDHDYCARDIERKVRCSTREIGL
jgi:Ca2+-binding RTX toxin-like protein